MMVELVVELHPSGLDDRCKSAPLRSGKVCNLVEFTMFGFHQELAFNSEKWIRMLIWMGIQATISNGLWKFKECRRNSLVDGVPQTVHHLFHGHQVCHIQPGVWFWLRKLLVYRIEIMVKHWRNRSATSCGLCILATGNCRLLQVGVQGIHPPKLMTSWWWFWLSFVNWVDLCQKTVYPLAFLIIDAKIYPLGQPRIALFAGS